MLSRPAVWAAPVAKDAAPSDEHIDAETGAVPPPVTPEGDEPAAEET
jgi:hypothetical protein